MHILIALIVIALALRFIYRFLINFPPFPGQSPLQGTMVDGLMEEDEFWSMISQSRQLSGRQYDDQVAELTNLLEHKSLNDIIAFERAFAALTNRANEFRYWEAAYALNWGCSDDCFIDFTAWWIGQGKNKFYWSVRYPRLFFFFAVRDRFQSYEGLQYCAGEAYKNLNGRDIPTYENDFTDTRGPMFNESLALLKYPELALFAW